MPVTHKMPGQHVYDDVTFMEYVPAHALDAVKNMKLRDDDLLLVTYPKAGNLGNNRIMMTSPNGNIFRGTGHLCGEFTGQRWIPRTKAGAAEL